jgi:hypothetical protein
VQVVVADSSGVVQVFGVKKKELQVGKAISTHVYFSSAL